MSLSVNCDLTEWDRDLRPAVQCKRDPRSGELGNRTNKYFTDGNEGSDEESWVKLGNGDILTYDIFASQC